MNLKPFLQLLPVLSLSLLLGACASDSDDLTPVNYSYITSNTAPVQAADKNAQAQLAEAAVSVSQSLQQLSAIDIATHPHAKMPAPYNATAIGMTQRATVTWSGPIQPLLNKIAAASQYHLHVIGKAPEQPVLVNVSANNQTLASILRDTQLNAGTAVVINVYPNTKTLELVYPNHSN